MIEEHCPCRLHRLLARYEPGSDIVVSLLAPKAAITVSFDTNATPPIPGVPVEGSAHCVRLRCKLLRRT